MIYKYFYKELIIGDPEYYMSCRVCAELYVLHSQVY